MTNETTRCVTFPVANIALEVFQLLMLYKYLFVFEVSLAVIAKGTKWGFRDDG